MNWFKRIKDNVKKLIHDNVAAIHEVVDINEQLKMELTQLKVETTQINEQLKMELAYLKAEATQINEQLKIECKHNQRYRMLIDQFIFNRFLDETQYSISGEIDDLVRNCKAPVGVYDEYNINRVHYGLQILFNNKLKFFDYNNELGNFDLAYIWGLKPWFEQSKVILKAQELKVPVLLLEDGFIRSVCTWNNDKCEAKYRHGISFTIDDLSIYINAMKASRLELMLNSDLVINEQQQQRATMIIKKIISDKVSKYNHQPIFTPNIGSRDRRKVLVVDQSYGDMSVSKGLANDNTFAYMLESAIKENPDADIIVKTHPDAEASKQAITGYYQNIEAANNIYKITYAINPISLIEYVDKVYVCTTQLGFEAVMCGKEVHVFGMPFYAGWGITHDRQTCERRTKERTLEEIFYITYIMYSRYINPRTKRCCEIEEAIEYILALREEYFRENSSKEL